jgi:hypothetical protein
MDLSGCWGEPSLGTTEHLVQTTAGLSGRDGWTRPTDLELDDSDDEPNLGGAGFFHEGNPYFNQQLWACSNTDDREGDEHDGREPDDDEGGEAEKEDNEPSLGWTAEESACVRKDDPTAGVKPIQVKTDGFHSWTEDEIGAFEIRQPVGTRDRLAFTLLLCTGQRRSDVVRMPKLTYGERSWRSLSP